MKVSFAPGTISHINWKHIDGPMYSGKDGYIHWLTLFERAMFKCKLMRIGYLEWRYHHSNHGG